MSLVIAGGSSRTIAAALALSPKTVETHRAKLMAKTGVSSLAELIRLGLLVGLESAALPPSPARRMARPRKGEPAVETSRRGTGRRDRDPGRRADHPHRSGAIEAGRGRPGGAGPHRRRRGGRASGRRPAPAHRLVPGSRRSSTPASSAPCTPISPSASRASIRRCSARRSATTACSTPGRAAAPASRYCCSPISTSSRSIPAPRRAGSIRPSPARSPTATSGDAAPSTTRAARWRFSRPSRPCSPAATSRRAR